MDALEVEKKRKQGGPGGPGEPVNDTFPANARVKDNDDKLSDPVHLPSNGKTAAHM